MEAILVTLLKIVIIYFFYLFIFIFSPTIIISSDFQYCMTMIYRYTELMLFASSQDD